MYAFATTPFHGLGMSGEQFWYSTPREFEAATKVFNRGREFQQSMYAGIMATLHNAHFELKNKQKFTPSMFLPGYKVAPKPLAEDDSWKQVLAVQRAVQQRQISAEQQRLLTDNEIQFEAKRRRAQAAQAAGASRAEIIAIMEGV